MKKLFALTLSLSCLSACITTVEGDTPDVTVKGDGYEVRVGDDYDHHRDFCPPGHAKKGWC